MSGCPVGGPPQIYYVIKMAAVLGVCRVLSRAKGTSCIFMYMYRTFCFILNSTLFILIKPSALTGFGGMDLTEPSRFQSL